MMLNNEGSKRVDLALLAVLVWGLLFLVLGVTLDFLSHEGLNTFVLVWGVPVVAAYSWRGLRRQSHLKQSLIVAGLGIAFGFLLGAGVVAEFVERELTTTEAPDRDP